ncbi:MAG: DUF4923 family protein [Muribaculaceae bacterium]|nr:DUF4923 family protein [Muribaculaceae bacterium]
MKTLTKNIILLLLTLTTTIPASAWDLKDILKAKNDSSKAGDIISGVVNSVTKQTMTIDDLQGTWAYSSPAVAFKSDNLLKKAGGAAAAKTLENKLLPIYQKTGITSMTVTFNPDSTFLMTIKKVKLKGNITTASDGSLTFNFKGLDKIKNSKMNGYVARTASNEVSLTFDATKLVELIEKVAQISNNSTLKAASAVLESYDGATMGFKIKKQ